MRSFRILIVGHGALPSALLSTAELICGPLSGVQAVGLHGHETPEHFGDVVRDAVGADSAPVLVLSDLLGGTPSNVAVALAARDRRITVIAGVNLALVVEAVVATERLDAASVRRLVRAARDGMAEPASALARRAS